MGFEEWLREEDGFKQQADFFRFLGSDAGSFSGDESADVKANYHVTYVLLLVHFCQAQLYS
jgi:hypothetical protein